MVIWHSAGLGFLILSVSAAAVSAQEAMWIDQIGTVENDYMWAIAQDGTGGAFVAGQTSGSLGGPAEGDNDAWIARYDSQGNMNWLYQFGTSGGDWANALAPDDEGGVFVAGTTWGSLGGPNAGSRDAWIARYDDAGNQIWVSQLGTRAIEEAYALASDGVDGVYMAGITAGDLGGPRSGPFDAWLARFDAEGHQIWLRQFGVYTEYVEANSLAPDGSGGVFVAGYTTGDLGGPNAGWSDVWIARFDAAGNRIWLHQFGTNAGEVSYTLASDGASGVFVAGYTQGDLGGPNEGVVDAWIAHYDAQGNESWIRQIGTIEDDFALAMASDGAEGVYVGGITYGDLGGVGAGGGDTWIGLLDTLGNWSWLRQFGTQETEGAYALAPDGSGRVFIGGFTGGDLGGTSEGLYDAWIARFGLPCVADFNGDGTVDTLDFIAYLNAFYSQNPGADLNGDGVINTLDFLEFLNAFNRGC